MKGYKSKMVVNALGRCARHHRDTSNNPPLLPPQPRLNLQHGRTCNFLAGKATSRRGTTLPDILHRAATRQPGEATHPDKGASPTIPFAAHANIYIYFVSPRLPPSSSRAGGIRRRRVSGLIATESDRLTQLSGYFLIENNPSVRKEEGGGGGGLGGFNGVEVKGGREGR